MTREQAIAETYQQTHKTSEGKTMGCVDTISHDRWPRQGGILGQRVEVVFHYNTDQVFSGVCIRDDREEPFEAIFALDNGRFVLASECQWRNVEGGRMTREEAARMCEAVVRPTFGTISSNDNNDAYKEAFEMAIAALRKPEWVRTVDRLPVGDEHKEMLVLYKGSGYLLYDIVQIGWLRLHPEMYTYWTHLPEKPEVEDEH